MKVYAESNFVLELVLEQEQHAACSSLVDLAEREEVTLALPAYSLFEPFTTLRSRKAKRQELHDNLQKELREIARTQGFAAEVAASPLPALLVRSAQEAAVRFDGVVDRLARVAQLLPLTASVFDEVGRVRAAYELQFPDAIVLACVMSDLDGARPSCFLNRNTEDFDDPQIVDALAARSCKMLGSFANGLQYVLANLRNPANEP